MPDSQQSNNQSKEDKDFLFDPESLLDKLQLQEEIKQEGEKSEQRDKTILVISIWAFILGLINLILNILQLS